jgi:hypothetical protein
VAGIGRRDFASKTDSLTIFNATVIASDRSHTFGIGGEYQLSNVDNVSGVDANATTVGPSFRARIGGGHSRSTVQTITINDSLVNATSGSSAAARGGGHRYSGVAVMTISASIINASQSPIVRESAAVSNFKTVNSMAVPELAEEVPHLALVVWEPLILSCLPSAVMTPPELEVDHRRVFPRLTSPDRAVPHKVHQGVELGSSLQASRISKRGSPCKAFNHPFVDEEM